MKKIKCPNCGSYKTVSRKELFQRVSGILFVISFFLFMFVITIPLASIGILSAVLSFFASLFMSSDSITCSGCHYEFNKKPIKKGEEDSKESNLLDSRKYNNHNQELFQKIILWFGGFVISILVFILGIGCWYITIPAILIYFFFRWVKIRKNKKFLIFDSKTALKEIKEAINIRKAKEPIQVIVFIISILSIIFIILVSVSCWYYSLPLLAIYWIWKKTILVKNVKIACTLILTIFIIFVPVYVNYINRATVININNPENGVAIQSEKILVSGSIDPKEAEVKINNTLVEVRNGVFEYEVNLPEENNEVIVFGINDNNPKTASSKKILVRRIFTAEELLIKKQQEDELRVATEIEAKRKEEERVKTEKEAEERRLEREKEVEERRLEREKKQEAEERAWDISKAGQLCKKHSDWSREDCEKLANKKIWIGMSLDMLKEIRGLPNSANPSNYGSGTHWQWCWHNYKPQCFYDNNEDGLIDAYN